MHIIVMKRNPTVVSLHTKLRMYTEYKNIPVHRVQKWVLHTNTPDVFVAPDLHSNSAFLLFMSFFAARVMHLF